MIHQLRQNYQKLNLHKTGYNQEEFLKQTFRTITKNWFAFRKNVLKPLAKSVLIPLGLTAAAVAASAIDAAVHKNIFESDATTLIISNEKMNYMKIVQSLEEYGLLRKDVSKTIKNEAKKQKRGFLSMLLGTLGASLFGNLLTGKGTIRAGGSTVRPGQDF